MWPVLRKFVFVPDSWSMKRKESCWSCVVVLQEVRGRIIRWWQACVVVYVVVCTLNWLLLMLSLHILGHVGNIITYSIILVSPYLAPQQRHNILFCSIVMIPIGSAFWCTGVSQFLLNHCNTTQLLPLPYNFYSSLLHGFVSLSFPFSCCFRWSVLNFLSCILLFSS